MKTKPTIHLNGTSAEALFASYADATNALREALRFLDEAAPNARDYYPQGDAAYRAAVTEHVSRVERLRDVLQELYELAEHVGDEMEARRR